MSMRTWTRKMAHTKAEWNHIENLNDKQFMNGRKQPSKFSMIWRRLAMSPIPMERRPKKKPNRV